MRRYGPMKSSRGTVIPPDERRTALARDGWRCVGPRVGMPGDCVGNVELDHVRASHGVGMKSRSTADNLATLCGVHHRAKTEDGRTWRPVLLAYLEGVHP